MGFKKSHVPWNKGKKGVQVPWNKGKKGVQVAWNKGTKGIMKPNSTSFKKGQLGWSKGLTKETSELVRKIAEKRIGQKRTDEMRKNAKKRIEELYAKFFNSLREFIYSMESGGFPPSRPWESWEPLSHCRFLYFPVMK